MADTQSFLPSLDGQGQWDIVEMYMGTVGEVTMVWQSHKLLVSLKLTKKTRSQKGNNSYISWVDH